MQAQVEGASDALVAEESGALGVEESGAQVGGSSGTLVEWVVWFFVGCVNAKL